MKKLRELFVWNKIEICCFLFCFVFAGRGEGVGGGEEVILGK